jgi:hypothetical protein
MSGRVGSYLRQNVLGLVAIFLALSAGAYAVQKAPKNSVVSKSIKDGQVKNPDLGAAAVTADKLGFDPATQAELNSTQATADATAAGLSALAAPGTINAAGNPVDWTKLKGVPDGIADGVDRLFGFAVTELGGDATPNVSGASVLSVSGSNLTITDLEEGAGGQVLTIHDLGGGGNVTVNDAAPFVLSGNWTSTDGDTLTVARLFTNTWVELTRSGNN